MSLVSVAIVAAVIIVLLVIVIAIASAALICGDLMSYTVGAETLTPGGASAGHALVVYNPGVTGAAKTAATNIATDLKSRGYTVELTGVRNQAAANASGYDVVIVGGPMYFGAASSSIAAYLKGLTLQNGTKLGVFATTGTDGFVDSDLASLEKQVASFQGDKKAAIRLIGDRDEKKATQSCKDLVSAVLQ